MKRTTLALITLALTGCKTMAVKPQPVVSLPPKGSVNVQEWEPKGCKQINEWSAFQSCDYLEPNVCEQRLITQIANYSAVQKGTHFWVKDQGQQDNQRYKHGIIYDCTDFVNNKPQGAK